MKHKRTTVDARAARKPVLWLTTLLVSLLSCCSCEEGAPPEDAARYHLMSYDSQDLTSNVVPRRFATVVLR